MTSSNENIFRVTGLLCVEFTGHRWILAQRPVTRIFGVFFDLQLNKQLTKQSWGWWFQTPSRSLWRQCNAVSFIPSHSLLVDSISLFHQCVIICNLNPLVRNQYNDVTANFINITSANSEFHLSIIITPGIYVSSLMILSSFRTDDECCCPRTVNISNFSFT